MKIKLGRDGLFLLTISMRIAIFFIASLACCCCPYRSMETSMRDSVRIETVVRTERIPDTVFVEVPAERERQTIRDSTSHLETSFAVSDARIDPDGALFHSLENKPQKRPVVVETKIVYRDRILYRDRTNTQTVEVERKLSWWQQAKIRGFWILLTILLFIWKRPFGSLLKKNNDAR